MKSQAFVRGLAAIFLTTILPIAAYSIGISGPLKKFPFHPDGHYSRETTSVVMGMTNKQSGDVCFRESTGDYSGHVPEATKCTTQVLKDTATEGTWRADCVLDSGDKVKMVSTISHVDSKTVKATWDIDAPQGVKVTGHHVFKYLGAKCPPQADPKKEKTAAAGPSSGPSSGPSDCEKYKNAMATCANIPAAYRSQCESAIKKSAIKAPPGCK